MSNPFGIDLSSMYARTAAMQMPHIGGGQVGGNINGGQVGKTQGTGGQPKVNPTQQGLNEVSNIGFAKKEGFMNGLGGTNNPDDHKLFMYA